ncbi:helix-turn-helix transcriptional regulator [Bordetella sp. LUAb4]|uniref:helix-turn-helix domain-containing protein n=1 Tax=Bordetella sp. LUAb4 TaxID=2843195 RepID=UPI001E4AC366|nr:helix-turn-helix transcriptional regulator [Bordetella sp. LUAb4]
MMRRALSLREHTCLHWAAQGKPSREIAQLLGVSERTINFHLQNACRKLSARNRRVAVVTALSMGLLDLDRSDTAALDTTAEDEAEREAADRVYGSADDTASDSTAGRSNSETNSGGNGGAGVAHNGGPAFTGGIVTSARMFAPPPVAAYPPGR